MIQRYHVLEFILAGLLLGLFLTLTSCMAPFKRAPYFDRRTCYHSIGTPTPLFCPPSTPYAK